VLLVLLFIFIVHLYYLLVLVIKVDHAGWNSKLLGFECDWLMAKQRTIGIGNQQLFMSVSIADDLVRITPAHILGKNILERTHQSRVICIVLFIFMMTTK
jgi:hypothetical protein